MSDKIAEMLSSKGTVAGRKINKRVEVVGASESQNGGKFG